MTITARVVTDSVAPGCPRLTTVLVRFPHVILPQVLTHRVFSRSTSSSRAIPIAKLISDVEADPYVPTEWRYAADRGMQPGELMSERDDLACGYRWRKAIAEAIWAAQNFATCGASKEHANRLLEPFSHVNMVITATEWMNFFTLRIDRHAQGEIRDLAIAIRDAMRSSTPRALTHGEWHLPFVDDDAEDGPKLSAARCARTSYLTHDGKAPDAAADLRLAEMLIREGHMSPLEHQARAWRGGHGGRNLGGSWVQHRQIAEEYS
jgi:thymidylate synthase ThyX